MYAGVCGDKNKKAVKVLMGGVWVFLGVGVVFPCDIIRHATTVVRRLLTRKQTTFIFDEKTLRGYYEFCDG